MTPKLYDFKGDEIYFEEVTNNLEQQHGTLEGNLAASDMDGTMFGNDAGVRVFLEKLSQPTFWTYSIQRFRRLLLPKEYEKAIINGSENQEPKLDPIKSQKLLALKRDIVKIYTLIYQLPPEEKVSLTIQHPLVNGFARKMILLDEIIMEFESAFFAEKFKGQLLMRTRFFADKNRADIDRLITQIFETPNKENSQKIVLSAHESNTADASQEIPPEEIPSIELDLVVSEIESVRRMLAHLKHVLLCKPFVVTTNLSEIAKGFIKRSKFSETMEPEVIASSLRERNGRFHPRINGKPIFGIRKQQKLKYLEEKHNAPVIAAAGDSPRNDWPMLIHSLRNEGIAIIVGTDYESTMQRFHDHGCFEQVENIQDIRWQILFALTDPN